MPRRKHNALTALQVKNLKIPGQYTDGNGLTLLVEESLTKRWFQRVTIDGKQRNTGLGGYPAVSLAAARDMAISNLLAIKAGKDIIEEKQRKKEAACESAPPVPTFAEAATRVIELRRPTWKNRKHAAQWESTLATYSFPYLGEMFVDGIEPKDVLAVLEPIWTEKHETANRVRQRIATVMDWAIQHGHRTYNPAGKSLLTALPPVRPEEVHHPALPYEEVGWAIAQVQESTANLLTKLGFEFLVLTASRSGEVRNANWGEILWERRTWQIPAIKMKARKVHRVPLSERAMEILNEAWEISGPDGLIFPANPGGKTMSDMVFIELLRRLDIPAVPHGFRSSFTDWAGERLPEYSEAADKALAHQERNKTRRAYKRTDLFDQRVVLMQKWADYVANADLNRSLEDL